MGYAQRHEIVRTIHKLKHNKRTLKATNLFDKLSKVISKKNVFFIVTNLDLDNLQTPHTKKKEKK